MLIALFLVTMVIGGWIGAFDADNSPRRCLADVGIAFVITMILLMVSRGV